MKIDNIDEIVALYLSEARQVLPRIEVGYFDLFSDGEKKIVRIGVQLPNGMAITYSCAKELDELAEKLSKREGLPIVITLGSKPTSKQSKKVPNKPFLPSHSKPKDSSGAKQSDQSTGNKAAEWKGLLDTVQKHIQNYELEQAEILTLKALELAETLPPDDRRQGINLEILTEVYFRMNRYEVCAPFLVRLLEMYKRCLGKDHVDTGTIIHNLAILYHNWGRDEQALPHYQDALRIKSSSLGDNHPDVQVIKSQLEQLQETINKPASVSQMLKRSKPSRRNRRNNLTRTRQLTELDMVPDNERLSD